MCATNNVDRRCRILAVTTLGLVARSVYARIRPSPLLYPGRHPLPKQLEEEASMDAPSALVSIALNDADDGVSSAALSALGMTVLSSSFITSSPGEDELLRECLSLTRNLVTPYAPSLRAVAEEDPSLPNLELSLRVLEQAVLPRLVQIVDRVAGYGSPQHLIIPALPLLTAALVHTVRTSAAALHGVDRSVFAKRWSELDAVGLADTFVTQLLLPLVEAQSVRSPAVALSLLRLAHVCPRQSWNLLACRAAASCLLPQVDIDAETKLAHLAYLVIATRPMPGAEKLPFLQSVTAILPGLPSTIGVPATTVSPGIQVEIRGYRQVRQPARMGLWSEVALSLVVDGPSSSLWDGSSASSTTSSRARALHAFLTTGSMGKIVAERGGGIGGDGTAASLLYEEVLLAFCQVGAETSKRFRSTADGTLWYPEDSAPLLLEWIQVAAVILAAFAPCVHLKSDDDMSLLTAGQASYVCLLQEYLFPTGFCNADGCVSVKLAGNACPPHLLWDQVGSSTTLLSRLEADPSEEFDGPAAKVIDELVSREIKHGMSSHPMRVYVLTLAVDHWIQGRIASIRKHLDSSSDGDQSHTPVLRAPSAREILLALSPRRVLAKLLEGQPLNPQQDDPKKRQRDPVRRLALETAKACVACIEGIALMTCDWRRRFGASPETKYLVSIAVGLLQGKVDETPVDDSVKAIMGPVCEAAVGRVQAFYESDGGRVDSMELSFPVSDLASQPFKPKIKPLITSTKLPATPREKAFRSHLILLCLQVVTSRAEQAVHSLSVADSLLSNARTPNYLRLSLPPLPESRDARLLGTFCQPLTSWGNSVNLSSASSDAVALVAAYTYRRFVRHDGAEEFRVTFLMRAFNTTPISFSEGLRLELGVVQKALDFRDGNDSTSSEVRSALGGITSIEAPLVSSAVVYKQEIKTGDHVTWELSLDPSVLLSNRVMMPSLVFRNVSVELPDVGATWVTGEKKSSVSGDASTHTGSAESKSGEDDFLVTKSDKGKTGVSEETLTEAVTVPGDPLFLTPMVGLLPCPMVFLRDRWGDSSTFRMFWFSLPYSMPPMKLGSDPLKKPVSPLDEKVVELSRLKWSGEAIPGGTATKLWAFSALHGSRVFCVLAEMENGKSSTVYTLHIRGDEIDLLFALTGSKAARDTFISALCPGMSINTGSSAS
jgi:hypothetical protein